MTEQYFLIEPVQYFCYLDSGELDRLSCFCRKKTIKKLKDCGQKRILWEKFMGKVVKTVFYVTRGTVREKIERIHRFIIFILVWARNYQTLSKDFLTSLSNLRFICSQEHTGGEYFWKSLWTNNFFPNLSEKFSDFEGKIFSQGFQNWILRVQRNLLSLKKTNLFTLI